MNEVNTLASADFIVLARIDATGGWVSAGMGWTVLVVGHGAVSPSRYLPPSHPGPMAVYPITIHPSQAQ